MSELKVYVVEFGDRGVYQLQWKDPMDAVPKALAESGRVPTMAAVESWQQLLRGIWESGLRLSEAMAMHWEIGRAHV